MQKPYLEYNKNLKEFSRNLRNNSTLSEVLLWNKLKAAKMMNYKFNRQKPLGEYIVDFYCKKLNLAIEIDGNSHREKYEQDVNRQNKLENMGLKILRFDDLQIKKDMKNVLRVIEIWIEENKNNPPNPLLKGGIGTPLIIESSSNSPFISKRKLEYYKTPPLFQRGLGGILLLFLSLTSFAQKENSDIRKGNKLFKEEKFAEAQENYLSAIEKNSKSFSGSFNLGDALYKQEKYEEAISQFNVLSQTADDKISKSKAFHNLGNSYLKSNKLEESIAAYKNALKNNPNDEEARYNLAFAQKLQQQQQQSQCNKPNESKEDKKKEEKKDEKKEGQNKKEEEQKKKEDQQKQEQQQQKPKDQISKQEAKQLLEALNNEEKNVQDKLNKKKVGVKVKIEKDW